ncbi:hypothetical protein PR048_008923, partial [Dryococelus australis]
MDRSLEHHRNFSTPDQSINIKTDLCYSTATTPTRFKEYDKYGINSANWYTSLVLTSNPEHLLLMFDALVLASNPEHLLLMLDALSVKQGEYGAVPECQEGETEEVGERWENLPTSCIFWHDYRVRKSRGDPTGNRTEFTLDRGERSSHCATTAPKCNRIILKWQHPRKKVSLVLCVGLSEAPGSQWVRPYVNPALILGLLHASAFQNIKKRLRSSTRRRTLFSNDGSPTTPLTPEARSRRLLGRTPTKLYGPFSIESPPYSSKGDLPKHAVTSCS